MSVERLEPESAEHEGLDTPSEVQLADDRKPTKQQAIEARIAELNRLYGLIDANVKGTTQVIGTIVVVLTGAAAALSFSPVAFALVPPLWSALMVYAQMADHDAMKWATVARMHEKQLNDDLEEVVYLYESRMASRGAVESKIDEDKTHYHDPVIYRFNVAYWAVLNIGSWVAATIVLQNQHGEPLGDSSLVLATWPTFTIAYAALGVAIWCFAIFTVLQRNSDSRHDKMLKALHGRRG